MTAWSCRVQAGDGWTLISTLSESYLHVTTFETGAASCAGFGLLAAGYGCLCTSTKSFYLEKNDQVPRIRDVPFGDGKDQEHDARYGASPLTGLVDCFSLCGIVTIIVLYRRSTALFRRGTNAVLGDRQVLRHRQNTITKAPVA